MIGLRIDEIEITTFRPLPKRRFLKGPVPWTGLCAAARLPGQALAVFIAIYHRAALTGSATIHSAQEFLAELGISRDAKARALHALQEASLVAVDRVTGRSARIRLLAAAKHGG